MPDIENANEDNAEFEQSDLAPSGAGTPSASDADATASEQENAADSVPEDGVPEDGVPEDGVPEDGVPEDAAPEGEDTRHWYIIHTYSGFERKVAESLRTRAEAFGFSDKIGEILIPEEEIVELRNGQKKTSKRLLYPGYVVVQMEMDDELWHRVKDTPRVTGFVGGGQTPVPLSADEINKMLVRQTNPADRPRPKVTYEKGEMVQIIFGPFTSFQGKIDDINEERGTLRVMVTIFGRSTPVELEFLQVEKLA